MSQTKAQLINAKSATVEFTAGSASTPAVTFTSDLNTGLYSPGADQVAISTGGTGRLFVDASGRVGIGTTSPLSNLVVSNGSNKNIEFQPGSTGYLFAYDRTAGDYLDLDIAGQIVRFSTDNGSERLRITSDGKVGIGTGSPSNRLHVSGSGDVARFDSSTTDAGLLFFDSVGGSRIGTRSANLIFDTSSFERARIDSSGRLLVGTSTARTNFFNTSGAGADLQVEGLGFASITRIINDQYAGILGLCKSRGAGNVIVQNDDFLGQVTFQGSDGSEFVEAAAIYCAVDGVPGANDMPGRLVFSTTADGASSPTERMRITSDGRVGIGTQTPGTTLTINGSARIQQASAFAGINIRNDNDSALVTTTSFVDASNNLGTIDGHLFFEHLTSGGSNASIATTPTGDRSVDRRATRLTVASNGTTTLNSAVSTTPFIAQINGAEVTRIDSSGRLLVGTSSAPVDGKLYVQGNSFSATEGGVLHLMRGEAATAITVGEEIGKIAFSDNAGKDFATITTLADAAAGTNDYPGRLVFSTTEDGASSPTERMRVNNSGGVFINGTSNNFAVSSTQAAGTTFNFIYGKHSGTSGSPDSGTLSFAIRTNGNLENTNNSYGGFSDIKLKENIVDAASQWSDIKALQVRKYNFKEGQTHTQIGLVAQEVELVSPGLITESPDRDKDGNDLGTVTKSVNYSVLYMKAVKALQEAMERIEQLEAEMAEVKAQLS